MHKLTAIVALLVWFGIGCAPVKTAPLPEDPVAHFPKMIVGDKYTFSITDLSVSKEGIWEVVRVEKDGSFLLHEWVDQSTAARKILIDKNYRIEVLDNKNEQLFRNDDSMLRHLRIEFPLFPGKRWASSFTSSDFAGRGPFNYIIEYSVDRMESLTTKTGVLRAFKIKLRMTGGTHGTKMGGNVPPWYLGEVWYSPEEKAIVKAQYEWKHGLYALSYAGSTAAPGGMTQSAATPVREEGRLSQQSPSPIQSGKMATGKPDAVHLAEDKLALALKAQAEKEALLKAEARRLEEKEAALKAEAARMTEEKLAAKAQWLAEKEAALKAEEESLEAEKRAAAVRSKMEKEYAEWALKDAKIKAQSENVETNIPRATRANPDAIAIVIGNQDYRNAKKVNYAVHDAEIMRKYIVTALGYKEGNVFFLSNATKADFELYFGNERNYRGKLYNAIKEGKSDVFIYYSGHGAPGLKDRKGYFVPAEADPQYLELSGYPLDVLYENLAKLSARSITVVLDACFSGATVYENISPLVLEVQNPMIQAKNMVVVASAAGTQVSSWYSEKSHSMFTYFLLRALKDKSADTNKDGKLTFDELYSYLSDKSEGVPYYARRINGVEQNPTISGQYQGRVLLTY